MIINIEFHSNGKVKMIVYILTVYLLLVASHHYVKSSSMCSRSNIIADRRLALFGYDNDTGPCECQITLQKVGSTPDNLKNIEVTKTHYPVGCYYKLSYWLGGNTTKIESIHENSKFKMELNGTLYVQMKNQVIGSGDLCFTFTVTTKTNDYKVHAKCENRNRKNNETTPPTTIPSTTTPPTTIPTTTTPPTTIPTTTIQTTTAPTTTPPTTTKPSTTTPASGTTSYPETSVVSQTDDNVSRKAIVQTVSPTTIVSTRDHTTIQASKEKIDDDTDDDNSLLPIILGCSVGGTVFIILVIVIVGCVSFRRRQTNTSSNTENNKHGEMIIAENDLYISSDSIPNNNNQHGTKNMAEMIITDNDVYISSDSIPNNDNQHGTKNMAEMEIIPNDLYQSSDSLADDLNDSTQHEHVPGQLEHVPNTNAEYAVIEKKPKKIPNKDNAIELNTSPNKVKADYDNVQIEKDNLKMEIDRIVGPKGDEYTLVDKY